MRKKLQNKVRERLDIGGFRKLGSELDSAKRDDVDVESILRRVKHWSIGFTCVGILSLGGIFIANSTITGESSGLGVSSGSGDDTSISYGDGFVSSTQQGTANSDSPSPTTEITADSSSSGVDLSGAVYIDGTSFTSERFESGKRKPVTEVEIRLSNLLSNKYQDGHRFYPIVGFDASDQSYYMLDTNNKIVFKAKEWGSGVEDNKYAYLYGKDMGMQAWLDVYKPRLMQGTNGTMMVENNVTAPIGFIRSISTELVGTAKVANNINTLQVTYPSDIVIIMPDGTQNADELSITAKLISSIIGETRTIFSKPFKVTVVYVSGTQEEVFNGIQDSNYSTYKHNLNVLEERNIEVSKDGRVFSK